MTQFVPGKPVQTSKPFVVVEGGLKPGHHRFQLEVMDGAGNLSRPATLVVTVQPPRAPKKKAPRP